MLPLRRIFLLIVVHIFFVTLLPLHAQSLRVDSLERVLVQLKTQQGFAADTLCIHTLTSLVEAEKNNEHNATRSFAYAGQAMEIAEKLNRNNTPYPRGLARVYDCLGDIYWQQSDYNKALDNYLRSLKISEQIGDEGQQAQRLDDIALVYSHQKNFVRALEYQFKALKILEDNKDWYAMAKVLNHIGVNYYNQKKYPEALTYYQKALVVNVRSRNEMLEATLMNNIGLILVKQEKFEQALPYYAKAMTVNQRVNRKYGLIWNYNGLGEIYIRLKNYDSAQYHLDRALVIAYSINSRNTTKETYHLQSQLYEARGNMKQALHFYKRFKELNDSIFDTEKSKQIAEMQTLYDTEKKMQENVLLKKENALHEENIQKQTAISISVSVALCSMIVLSYIALRSRRKQQRINALLKNKNDEIFQKNKLIENKNQLLNKQHEELLVQNEELHQQQEEISLQRDFIEQQNQQIQLALHQIKSSISAAQKIQAAILPFEHRMNAILKEYFVIYRPKDIVSGDFYWVEKVGDMVMVAAVDCTGHGVAGAFMSMIGHTLLDKIVVVDKITEPAQILEQLDSDVHYSLKQDEKKDYSEGMDLSICAIRQMEDGNLLVRYAGANRPLYYFSGEKTCIDEIKGTHRSIGKSKSKAVQFQTHELVLKPGAVLYLTSDGYSDQNDAQRERLGSVRFKQMLCEIATLPLLQQQSCLEKILARHQGDEPQRDDILVMGIRI